MWDVRDYSASLQVHQRDPHWLRRWLRLCRFWWEGGIFESPWRGGHRYSDEHHRFDSEESLYVTTKSFPVIYAWLIELNEAYENRLFKYRNHGFDVYWENLDRSRIRRDYIDDSGGLDKLQTLSGLSRLVFYEDIMARYTTRQSEFLMYQRQRKLEKIDDIRDPILAAPSRYVKLEIPYGERFTSVRPPYSRISSRRG